MFLNIQITQTAKKMRSFLPILATGGHSDHTEAANVILLLFAQLEMHLCCRAAIIVSVSKTSQVVPIYNFPVLKYK